MIKQLLLFSAFLFSISFSFSQEIANPPAFQGRFHLEQGSNYLPGRILFRIRPEYRMYCQSHNITEPYLQKAFQLLAATRVAKAFEGSKRPERDINDYGQKMIDLSLVYELDYSANLGIEEAVNLLLYCQAIEYAQPSFMYQVLYDPDDPDTAAWHIGAMKLKQAWDISKGDSTFVAGIVDTGISFLHPEFFGMIALNPADTIDGLDNDNDGYIDNYKGWDLGGDYFMSPGDNDPTYCCGGPASDHGVLIAGVIGAKPDNQICVPGVGFDCRLLPVKATVSQTTWMIRAYQGVVYAADHGADVINMSFGGTERDRFSKDAIYYAAVNKGVLCVAAAGNEVTDVRLYPASYPCVMSTGGTMPNLKFWDYGGGWGSSYCYQVDIAAPAATITTTAQHGLCWGSATGTSLAAPMICGTAALVKGADSTLNNQQIGQRIRVTADSLPYVLDSAGPPDYTEKMGKGAVNAFRAVTETGKSIRAVEVEYDDHNDGILMANDTIDVRVRFLNYLDPITNVNVTLTTMNPSFIQILHGDSYLGDFGTMDTVSMWHCPFRIKINAGVSSNFTGNLKFTFTGNGYSDYEYYTIDLNPSYIPIDQNDIETSIDNIGHLSIFNFPTLSQGSGTIFESVGYYALDAGFMVGNASTKVSSNFRNSLGNQDTHFQNVQSASRIVPGPLADLEATSVFNDNGAGANKLNVEVTEKIYQYKTEEDDDYFIIQYNLRNTTATPVSNAYAGMFADWELAVYDSNFTTYNAANRMIMIVDSTHYAPHFAGWSVLSSDSLHAFSAPESYSFTMANKYSALTADPNSLNEGKMDLMSTISTGPFTIPANGTHTVAFAWLKGFNYSDLYAARAAALKKYNCIILGNMSPLADLGPDIKTCIGPNTINLNPGAGFSSYLWSNGSTAPTLAANLSGIYSVTVTDSNGCEDYDEIKVTIGNSIAGGYTCSPPSPITLGDTIWFTDITSGSSEWCWNFGDGTSNCPILPLVYHVFNTPGIFPVTMIVSNGSCSDTVTSCTIQVDSMLSVSPEFEKNSITVFPVPSQDLLTVTINNTYSGPISLRLFSLTGILLKEVTLYKNKGNFTETLSLSGLSAGIYFLEAGMGDRRETAKIVLE